MTNVMKGKKWLNLAKNKEIRYKFDSIQVNKVEAGVVYADAIGVFDLNGGFKSGDRTGNNNPRRRCCRKEVILKPTERPAGRSV